MHGVGPPLVTPFTAGEVDYPGVRDLVTWVQERGVDFVVPCGSNSEAELLTQSERERVIETVVEAASVPVLAGTGAPGRTETEQLTAAAADAGADAALVITPFYYDHDQETLVAYFEEIADSVDIPVYLYSVPSYTGVRLTPESVGALATHPNIVGMKDSAGDLPAFIRTQRRVTDETFELLVGSGGLLAQAVAAGASGGVLALANLFPERTAEIYEMDDPERARESNAELVEVNTAITSKYGVPGLKWAMRQRGAPAGYPRSPHRRLDEQARRELESLIR